MAIDTRDRRASCLGINGPYRFILPNPDAAAEDQGDRQQMAFSYPGILAVALFGHPAIRRFGSFILRAGYSTLRIF